MSRARLQRPWPAYTLIAGVALAAHGLLLLNDGVYWDGWIVYSAYHLDKDWQSLALWFSQYGTPWLAYLHAAMGFCPAVLLGYRLLVFAALTVSSVLVYRIGVVSRYLTAEEALAVALLSLSYPADQAAVTIITMPYHLSYMVFLVGVLLALRAERTSGPSRLVWRIAALACFFASFTVASLLVFYMGFLLLLMAYARSLHGLSLREALLRIPLRRLDFVLLPFLYWFIKNTWFAAYGAYATYNQIRLSPTGIVVGLLTFFRNSVYFQINDSLSTLLAQPALLLGAGCGLLWACRALRIQDLSMPCRPSRACTLLAFGCILFLLGVFPYLAAGKVAACQGWTTRHALLVGLPMALIIVAFVRGALAGPKGRAGAAGLALLATLISAFCLSLAGHNLAWQARWVADRSLMANLAAMDDAKNYSVYWIDNRFSPGVAERYRPYEWSAMFKQVWHDESRIGLYPYVDPGKGLDPMKAGLSEYANDAPTLRCFGLSTLNPEGPQAILKIEPEQRYSNVHIVLKYFYCRFLHPEKMEAFLKTVTRITVTPVKKDIT